MTKILLHYTPNSNTSAQLVNKAHNTFTQHGWDVELVEGRDAEWLKRNDEIKYDFYLPFGRLHDMMITAKPWFETKLAVLTNHIAFWERVVEANETLIYAEHDAVCDHDYFNLPDFNDVLCLHLDHNTYETLKGHLYPPAFPNFDKFKMEKREPGVYDLPDDWIWCYESDNGRNCYWKAKCIPTAQCYALTPAGATKLLRAIEENGIEQGDVNINSYNVNIQYYTPAIVHTNEDPELYTCTKWEDDV